MDGVYSRLIVSSYSVHRLNMCKAPLNHLIETSGIDGVCDIGARQVVLQLSTLFSLVLLVFCVEHSYRKNYICYSGSRDLEALFQHSTVRPYDGTAVRRINTLVTPFVSDSQAVLPQVLCITQLLRATVARQLYARGWHTKY